MEQTSCLSRIRGAVRFYAVHIDNDDDDDDVELHVLGYQVDILGTNCDQCLSMGQCCFTSTETVRLIRTDSPGRPPRLSHSSWPLIERQDQSNYGSYNNNISRDLNIATRRVTCFSFCPVLGL